MTTARIRWTALRRRGRLVRKGAAISTLRSARGPAAMKPTLLSRVLFAALSLLLGVGLVRADDPAVELHLNLDDTAGKALPCRVHLFDPANKPVQPPGQPFWKDHFCCDGRL